MASAATPDRIWRHFLDATGTLHITGDTVTCALNLRSHHPVLIDAGFADLQGPHPGRVPAAGAAATVSKRDALTAAGLRVHSVG